MFDVGTNHRLPQGCDRALQQELRNYRNDRFSNLRRWSVSVPLPGEGRPTSRVHWLSYDWRAKTPVFGLNQVDPGWDHGMGYKARIVADNY